MVHKNKNHTKKSNLIARIGMATMVMATVAATAEAAIHEGQKLAAALQTQTSYASIQDHAPLQAGHEIRRAGGPKEEIQHSSASYGSMKRSASVSGSL